MLNICTDQIKAIIGLGNPGAAYYKTRHSIGFRVVDELAHMYDGNWRHRDEMETADVIIDNKKVILVKPQTFMNSSGRVIPFLIKQGIRPENVLVVHDELEMPFGKIAIRKGGSARGHNGLRSIIEACGPDFYRLRFGVARPERKEDVGNYVLQPFSQKPEDVEYAIENAVKMINECLCA